MQIEEAGALVTGGASGLGEATVRRLTARGAVVTIVDRDTARAEALAKELGRGTQFATADVTDQDQMQAAVDQAASAAPLRIVVNCAGLGWAGRVGGGELRAPPQLFGQGLGPGGVAVHDRDHGPAGCEPPDGCLTESRRPSGDECPCLFDLHEREI